MNYAAMESQLNDSYKELFAKATTYRLTQNYQNDFADERIADLFDLLLTAQDQGTPIERIAGKDTERFCKDLFSDYTLKDRFIGELHHINSIACFVFVIELITLFGQAESAGDFFSVKTNVLGYLLGIGAGLISDIVIRLIYRPTILKAKKVSSGKWSFIILGTIFGLIAIAIAIFGGMELELPLYPMIIGSGAYIIVYTAVTAVLRYKKYGTVRNVKKKLYDDSYYKSLADLDMEKALMEAWLKRYERLSKKGKTTEEGYIDVLKNDERKNRIGDKITLVFYIVIIAGFIFAVARDSTVIDTLIFSAIIITLESAIYYAFHKGFKKGSALRMKHIAECERSGMTMPEYIRKTLEPASAEAAEVTPDSSC